MNTLLTLILLLTLLGGGVYLLALATRLVKAVEKIANRSDDFKVHRDFWLTEFEIIHKDKQGIENVS